MGVYPLRELRNGLRQAGLRKAALHLFPVNILCGLGNTFRNRGIQNGKPLKHSGKQAVIRAAVKFTNILPVQQHAPLGGVVKAAQQHDHGGLARAVQPHHRQPFAGADGQIHLLYNVLLRTRIAEGHILQPQLVPIGDWRLCAARKLKRLRNMQIFLYFGQVDALLVQLAALGQDAGHPRCRAADGGKVEQKGRCGPAVYQRLADQVRIRDAVAH